MPLAVFGTEEKIRTRAYENSKSCHVVVGGGYTSDGSFSIRTNPITKLMFGPVAYRVSRDPFKNTQNNFVEEILEEFSQDDLAKIGGQTSVFALD